jgi:hypothetical protein
MKYESTLSAIAEQIFNAKTCTCAKEIFVNYVNSTRVKDKVKMITEVNKMTTLYQIQKYTANALLKFEGLGLNQLNHTSSTTESNEGLAE